MEEPKKKSSNIFQSVADKLSRFFRKEDIREQNPQVPEPPEPEVPKTVENPQPVASASVQKPEQASKPVEEKKPEAVSPDVATLPIHADSAESAVPTKPARVRRKRKTIRKQKPRTQKSIKSGEVGRKVHEEEVIPITSLPNEAVGPAIYDFVIAHISDGTLNVDTMASQLKTSRTGLYTLVHREFGVTPANLILDLRLKHAENLLKKGIKVREVSVKCGFSDPKYFSKVFKKYYGVLPSSYGTDQ